MSDQQSPLIEGSVTRREWRVWGLEAAVVVDDPAILGTAEEIVRDVVDEVDRASSRFRPDSELSSLRGRLASGAAVSEVLAILVARARDAAELSDGDVDPTLGNDMVALGYDRDFADITESTTGISTRILRSPAPGWTRISLQGRILTVPDDLTLDLGATAKAAAADLAAERVLAETGAASLVSLGGDIATAGESPEGWRILVLDTPADPSQHVRLESGWAIATSSTQKRRWMQDGRHVHHILDPRSGLPAPTTLRTATVVARRCWEANALSTAAIVRGRGALGWLDDLGVPARLVDDHGRVFWTRSWPAPAVQEADDV